MAPGRRGARPRRSLAGGGALALPRPRRRTRPAGPARRDPGSHHRRGASRAGRRGASGGAVVRAGHGPVRPGVVRPGGGRCGRRRALPPLGGGSLGSGAVTAAVDGEGPSGGTDAPGPAPGTPPPPSRRRLRALVPWVIVAVAAVLVVALAAGSGNGAT